MSNKEASVAVHKLEGVLGLVAVVVVVVVEAAAFGLIDFLRFFLELVVLAEPGVLLDAEFVFVFSVVCWPGTGEPRG
jgi:hypothetical protein